MMLQRTRNTFILATLFFLGTAALLVFVVWLVSSKSVTLKESVEVVANNSAREQQLSSLNRVVKESETERQRLQDFILTEAETISFLTTIEDIARKQNISLKTDNLSVKDVEDSALDTLHISFSIEGSLAQIETMVELFETVPYHGYVESVDFSSAKDAAGQRFEADVQLVLSIATYD